MALSASIYTPHGRLDSCLLGALRQVDLQRRWNTKVEVTMKNISRRKITSVIEAIEKIDVMSYWRFSDMAVRRAR